MESSSDDDSWATMDSSCDWMDSSELECSTCSSLNDEDCSYKRSEAEDYDAAAAAKKPKFAREECFKLVDTVENDLAEEYVRTRCSDDENEELKISLEDYSSTSCSSDSEEEEEPVPETWSATDTRKTFPFTDTPAINAGSAETPLDYFHLVFNKDFVQFLVDTINTRGTELAKTKKKVYIPTDLDEVYTLLSIHFMMGYTNSISEHLQFGVGPSLNLDFNTFMKRERYALLFGLLTYINLKKNKKGYRSWYEVAKPVGDKFNALMKSIMVPGKNLNIEKGTVLSFNDNNMVRKRTDRIRMHFIADDNGILQRVFIVDPLKQLDVRGEKIARALMADFLDTGRSLHLTDEYYTSVPLAEDLLSRKTYLSGVLKKNRPKNPAFLKYKVGSVKMPVRTHKPERSDKKKTKKSTNQSQSKENIIVHGYNEKGVCVAKVIRPHLKFNLLSTEVASEPAENKEFECKIIEHIYQHTNMNKRNNQLSKCGPHLQRKHNRHVAYLLQALCVNTYLIYKVKTGKKIKFIKFLEEILHQMLPLECKEDVNKENEDENRKRKPKRRNNDEPNACVHA